MYFALQSRRLESINSDSPEPKVSFPPIELLDSELSFYYPRLQFNSFIDYFKVSRQRSSYTYNTINSLEDHLKLQCNCKVYANKKKVL